MSTKQNKEKNLKQPGMTSADFSYVSHFKFVDLRQTLENISTFFKIFWYFFLGEKVKFIGIFLPNSDHKK